MHSTSLFRNLSTNKVTGLRAKLTTLTCLILAACSSANKVESPAPADLIVINAKVFTQAEGFREAFAVKDGKFLKVGTTSEIMAMKGENTRVIDASGKTIIPGLVDTHAHPIRAGLNYNLELRWDGVKSLKEGLQMIKEQAARTPEGQWVRVVGGWSPHQFVEKRLPTIAELNEASPNRPVFVMYLYSLGYLNRKGVEALGYSKATKFPGGEVQLDKQGKPTGVLIAKPNAFILYKTLVSTPKLANREQERNSTILFFREMSRLGLTSVLDAGGGGFFFPEDHVIAKELNDKGELAVKLPFFLFAPTPGKELGDFERWIKMVSPATRHELSHAIPYHLIGGGENLTWAAADFENFLEPRPELPATMEKELKPILQLLFKSQWMFRIHATYDESIARVLNVIEEIKREGGKLPERFIIDHAETVSAKNLERIAALGGGVAVQARMAYQGEEFIARYGKKAAAHAPPVSEILKQNIPLGLGTDATRVASYNPWIALHWAVTGKTLGGVAHLSPENRLSREKALYTMTKGAAWFTKEEAFKGDIRAGEIADFAVLTDDYFTVPEERIKEIRSLLTSVNGRIVHGEGDYRSLAPEVPPAVPEWSPVNHFGGYQYAR